MMPARRPLVRVGGQTTQLPAGYRVVGAARTVGAAFDGGGTDITVGAFCDVRIPFGLRIDRATLVGSPAGSITIDVRTGLLSNYPATASICAGSPPALSGGAASENTALTAWSRVVAPDSIVRFVVTACSGVTQATVQIEGVDV